MEKRVNIILLLLATMFAFNVALSIWIIRAFRLQPGHDLAERVKIAEAAAAQSAHNHTNVMQALEFEQHLRRRNSEKIDRVLAILETKQHENSSS